MHLIKKYQSEIFPVRKWLSRYRQWIRGICIYLFVLLFVIYFLVAFPILQVQSSDIPIGSKDWIIVENEIRRTAATIVGGLFAIGTIAVALMNWWNIRQRNSADRFTSAVEMLNKNELTSIIGAIYALEGISKDSPEYYWPVMELLCSYLRDKNAWGLENERETVPIILQTIITVLGRRKLSYGKGEENRLILTYIDLRKVNFTDLHFESANFRGSHFELSTCWRTKFQDTLIERANFEQADLHDADFRNSYTHDTRFKDRQVNFEEMVDEEKKITFGIWPTFHETDFRGANLFGAVGITETMLNNMITDSKTILPEYLEKRLYG